MLPYRRRTPVYGGKLKRKKQEEAQQQDGTINQGEPLAGGGPVQCAIRSDLLEHRRIFTNQVAPVQRGFEDFHETTHNAGGNVFASFKEVFGCSKMALLHTRVIPPRCDRDAYSQLIYAACFSLLRDAFSTDGCIRLDHAAYALFCLFSLYETNPLLTGPHNERDMLNMLPLGLQSAENAKLLYRRAFKTPIRIDRTLFGLLQRLRDEAVAQQAECRLSRMRAREQHIHALLQEEETASNGYTCICGVATDTLHVLDRMFTANAFDMTQYTGPCGLEGLAGHEDYPFGACRSKKKLRNPEQSHLNTTALTDLELDAVGVAQTTEIPCVLLTSMETYWSHLESIQSPQKTRARAEESRMQNSLETLRQRDDSSCCAWKSAQQLPFLNPPQRPAMPSRSTETANISTESGQVRVVEGVSHVVTEREGDSGRDRDIAVVAERRDQGDQIPNGVSSEQANNANARLPYQFIIPNELPNNTQAGIRKALEVLMEREGEAVLKKVNDSHMKTPLVVAAPVFRGDVRSGLLPSARHGGDDWSSVGFEAASVQSIATGRGASALRALLLSVSTAENEAAASVPRPPAVARMQQANPLTRDRNQFLTLDSSASQTEDREEGYASAVSDLSSDDEASMAASAAGQTALRTLLATVNDISRSKPATTGKAQKRKKNNCGTESVRLGKSDSESFSHVRKRGSDETSQGSSSKHHFSDEESFVSMRGSGSSALDVLLSRVPHDRPPDR